MDKPIPEAVRALAAKWREQAKQHGVRTFTGNDHGLFANELEAALTAAQQQGQAVACPVCSAPAVRTERAVPWAHDSDEVDTVHGFQYAPQPMQQGGGEVESARRLAVGLWQRHYREVAPEWEPCPDLAGLLSQIDNMASGLCRFDRTSPPSAPVGVDLEQFREAVMFWKGWAAIGLAVEKIGPFTLRQEEDVYQQRVNEADRLLALIDRASPLQACNCPGEGKTDPSLHAPNCPVRLAQQPAAVTSPHQAKEWLLELMGDHDFTMPTEAFNELVEALATQHQEPTT